MRIDRARFLALTTALTAAACGAPAPLAPLVDAPAPPATASGPVPAAAASPASSSSSPATAPAPAPAPEAIAPAVEECAQEDVGSLAVCAQLKIAPTCEDAEGQRLACRQLGMYYRPAVAERIATCEQTAAKGKRCPRAADNAACQRQAVNSVCVRATVRASCAEMIANCKRRSQRVRYTLDQCAKMLSAAAPDHVDDLVYTMGGIDAQGAPWNEGCWID